MVAARKMACQLGKVCPLFFCHRAKLKKKKKKKHKTALNGKGFRRNIFAIHSPRNPVRFLFDSPSFRAVTNPPTSAAELKLQPSVGRCTDAFLWLDYHAHKISSCTCIFYNFFILRESERERERQRGSKMVSHQKKLLLPSDYCECFFKLC